MPLVLLRTAPQVSSLLLEAAEAAPASAIVGPGGGCMDGYPPVSEKDGWRFLANHPR